MDTGIARVVPKQPSRLESTTARIVYLQRPPQLPLRPAFEIDRPEQTARIVIAPRPRKYVGRRLTRRSRIARRLTPWWAVAALAVGLLLMAVAAAAYVAAYLAAPTLAGA
jgi:hypothetical protein